MDGPQDPKTKRLLFIIHILILKIELAPVFFVSLSDFIAYDIAFIISLGMAFGALALDYWATRLDRRQSWPKLLHVGNVFVYTGLLIFAILDVAFLPEYMTLVWMGGIGLVMTLSICLGRPFTMDFSLPNTPPEVAATKLFYRINVFIASVWVALLWIPALLSLIPVFCGGFDPHRSGPHWTRIVFNWVTPSVFVLGGFMFNILFKSWARSHRLLLGRVLGVEDEVVKMQQGAVKGPGEVALAQEKILKGDQNV